MNEANYKETVKIQLEEIDKLKKEIIIDDFLLVELRKLLDAIPECPVHGKCCIPFALEWIEDRKNIAVIALVARIKKEIEEQEDFYQEAADVGFDLEGHENQ